MGNALSALGRSGLDTSIMNMLEVNRRQEATGSQIAMSDVQRRKLENEIKREDQHQKWLKTPIDLNTMPFVMKLSPENKKLISSYFTKQGIVNELGVGETGDVLKGIEFMERTTEGLQTYLEPIVKEQQGQLLQMQTELTEMKEKGGGGNEKKVAELEEAIKKKAKEVGQSNIVYSGALEQARKIELEQVKAKEKERRDIATAKALAESKEKLERIKQEKTEITPTKILGNVLFKWLNKAELTTKEKKILEKHFSTSNETPESAYKKARQRLRARVDEFEATVKRKATIGEQRKMFFNDPYGILEPEKGESEVDENKPVPPRSKNESLADYLKRVAQ